MLTPKSTKKGQRKSPSSVEKGREFQNEFKTAAQEVRSKIASEIFYPNARSEETCNVQCHVLFTYTHANGLKSAAVVELRDVEYLCSNPPTMDRLRLSKKNLLEKGYHKVYTYLYVHKRTRVSDPLKSRAENEAISIINNEEMTANQLIVEIDRRLQLAPDPKLENGAAKSLVHTKNLTALDDTDSAVSAPGE